MKTKELGDKFFVCCVRQILEQPIRELSTKERSTKTNNNANIRCMCVPYLLSLFYRNSPFERPIVGTGSLFALGILCLLALLFQRSL